MSDMSLRSSPFFPVGVFGNFSLGSLIELKWLWLRSPHPLQVSHHHCDAQMPMEQEQRLASQTSAYPTPIISYQDIRDLPSQAGVLATTRADSQYSLRSKCCSERCNPRFLVRTLMGSMTLVFSNPTCSPRWDWQKTCHKSKSWLVFNWNDWQGFASYVLFANPWDDGLY